MFQVATQEAAIVEKLPKLESAVGVLEAGWNDATVEME